MTDREIEIALTKLASGKCSDVTNMDYGAVLEYINRLKEACKSAIQSFTRIETLYKLKCNELENVKEQVRKDTAREILRMVLNVNPKGIRYYFPEMVIARRIKEKYGVEVKE